MFGFSLEKIYKNVWFWALGLLIFGGIAFNIIEKGACEKMPKHTSLKLLQELAQKQFNLPFHGQPGAIYVGNFKVYYMGNKRHSVEGELLRGLKKQNFSMLLSCEEDSEFTGKNQFQLERT